MEKNDYDYLYGNRKFTTEAALLERFAELGYPAVTEASRRHIPIDGIVAIFDSLSYSKSCGKTGHHYKDGLAYKFEDKQYETIFRKIEWTPTRFGEIAPVGIYPRRYRSWSLAETQRKEPTYEHSNWSKRRNCCL